MRYLAILAAVLGFTDQVVIKSATVKAPTCAATHVAMAQAEAAAKGLTYGGCGDGELPLLTETMVLGQNDGGFCPPDGASNGQYLDFSPGWTIGYSPERNTIYWAGGSTSKQYIAELSIPALTVTTNPALMNQASFQAGGLVEPTEGAYPNSWPGSPGTDGVLTVPVMLLPWTDGKLYGAFAYYYESGSPTTHPFYSRPLDLSTTGSVSGMYMPWTATGSATGYHINRMISVCAGRIPSEWQASFGNKPAFLCSGATYSIISNQSYGPSIWPMNPATDITGNAVANIKPAVFYPSDHLTGGDWDNFAGFPTEWMDFATQITGCVMVNGTRSTLCFGTHGSGSLTPGYGACYGIGLSDPDDPRIGTSTGSGEDLYCYDPVSPDHGNHAFPYLYAVWAYDTNDLAAAYAGTINAWDVEPYGLWDFDFPIDPGTTLHARIRGIGYDPTNRYLYVVQDRAGCSGNNGVVWRYTVDITP